MPEKCAIRTSYSASVQTREADESRSKGARGQGIQGLADAGARGLGASEDRLLARWGRRTSSHQCVAVELSGPARPSRAQLLRLRRLRRQPHSMHGGHGRLGGLAASATNLKHLVGLVALCVVKESDDLGC